MSTGIFTVKEEEILRLKINGKLNKEIAELLDISEAYVSQTLKNAAKKINDLSESIDLLSELGMTTEPAKTFSLGPIGKRRLEDSLKRVRKRIILQRKEPISKGGIGHILFSLSDYFSSKIMESRIHFQTDITLGMIKSYSPDRISTVYNCKTYDINPFRERINKNYLESETSEEEI